MNLSRSDPPRAGVGDDASPTHHWENMLQSMKEAVFVLPLVAIVGVLIVWPTVTVVGHAFSNWHPGSSSPYVGFANFVNLAKSSTFHTILVNQAILLLGVPIWTVLPLIIAVALYERVPGAGIFRTIYFLPATASPAIIGILFTFLLAPAGPINGLSQSLGLGEHNWLTNSNLVRPTLIVVLAWATVGTGVVIFTAGLSTIDPQLFEAAQLDGANWWARFWYVARPALHHVTELWVVIIVMTVFVAIFPWIFTLTRGGPGYSSTTIDFSIYQNGLSFGYFGLAAAESVCLLVIVIVIFLFGGLLARRTHDS